MATKHKTSGTIAALAIVLALNLLSLPTLSDACGCKCCPCTKPPPTPSPSPSGGKCPVDALKLGVCANVLGGLINLELGSGSGSQTSKKKPCCELIGGLADLDAAVCLCTALRANVLGIVSLNLPVQLSVLVNYCGKKLPAGFQCPNNKSSP